MGASQASTTAPPRAGPAASPSPLSATDHPISVPRYASGARSIIEALSAGTCCTCPLKMTAVAKAARKMLPVAAAVSAPAMIRNWPSSSGIVRPMRSERWPEGT